MAKKEENDPLSLAGRAEAVALGLLELMENGVTHAAKNRGIETAADAIGAIAAEVRPIASEHGKAAGLLEDLVRSAAEKEKQLAEKEKQLAEAIEANEGFVGIEADLATSQAAYARLLTEAKSVAGTDSAEVKMARDQRDAAKRLARAAVGERDDALRRLGNIRADLKKHGIHQVDDLAKVIALATRAKALKAEIEDMKRIDEDSHIIPEMPEMPERTFEEGLMSFVANGAAAGISPETMMGVLPRLETSVSGLVNRVVIPLIESGLLVGGPMPSTMMEAANLEAAPVAFAESADPNEVVEAAVAAFEAALSGVGGSEGEATGLAEAKAAAMLWKGRYEIAIAESVGLRDLLEGDGDLAGSRRRLITEFGSAELVDGVRTYRRMVPTMVGWAPRSLGGVISALALRATLPQPFALTIKTEAGVESVVATAVDDMGDHMVVYRPNDKIGQIGGSKKILGGDSIIGIACAQEKVKLGSESETTRGIASSLGLREGLGLMKLPKGHRVVDPKGTPLPNVPLFNLDELALYLVEEAAALV